MVARVWPIIPALILSASITVGQQERDLQAESLKERPEGMGEQKVALVFGNEAYSSAPLRNPVNDARAMTQRLEACGFSVIERINCSKKAMYDAIRAFERQIQKGGVGLVYYAGHGAQIEGRNYLVPVDADVQAENEVEFACIDAEMVLRKMEDAGNRVNIMILDACRDNPFARSFRSSQRGLAQMGLAASGSILAYATAPGKVAADGDGANGLYTSMLLHFITVPGLTIEEVFKNVRSEVIASSSGTQIPWEVSSLTGDFYFTPPVSGGESNLSSVVPKPPLPTNLLSPPVPLSSPYFLEFSLGGIWPEEKDLFRVFSKDADSKILSEPAPAVEMTVKRRLKGEFQNAQLSLFLAWPKSLPTRSSDAGYKGVLTALVLGVERPLPLGFSSHKPYLIGGMGLWLIKFSRTRFGEALDLNPAFKLGFGSDIRPYRQGTLRVEGAYFPFKGPTYVVNTISLILKYAR